jgi:hypothetical protein
MPSVATLRSALLDRFLNGISMAGSMKDRDMLQ